MVVGLIAIICVSLIIISLKEFRNDRVFFTFFGFFAFIALPVALGFLPVYWHIIRVGQYRIGDGVLLLLSCVMFAMYGVNLHDVLWCGVATDWFSNEVIGGYDLALFFTTFGISDPSRWSYRTFGIYMMMKSGVQLVTGSVALIKYFNLHSQNGLAGFRLKKYSAFGLLFLGGTFLAIVQFIFDSPWFFTDFQYYLGLFGGIVLVIFLFLKAGSNFE
jgi:hypothetical protein